MGVYAHFPVVCIKVCSNNSVDCRTRGLSRGLWGKRDTEQNTVQKPSLSDDGQDVTFLRQQTDNSLNGKTGKIIFSLAAHLKVGRSVWKMVKEPKTDQVAILRRSHTHTRFWVIMMIINTISTSALGQFHVGLRGNVRNFPSTN